MPRKELYEITRGDGSTTRVTPATLAKRLGKEMRPRTALDTLDTFPKWMRKLSKRRTSKSMP